MDLRLKYETEELAYKKFLDDAGCWGSGVGPDGSNSRAGKTQLDQLRGIEAHARKKVSVSFGPLSHCAQCADPHPSQFFDIGGVLQAEADRLWLVWCPCAKSTP